MTEKHRGVHKLAPAATRRGLRSAAKASAATKRRTSDDNAHEDALPIIPRAEDLTRAEVVASEAPKLSGPDTDGDALEVQPHPDPRPGTEPAVSEKSEPSDKGGGEAFELQLAQKAAAARIEARPATTEARKRDACQPSLSVVAAGPGIEVGSEPMATESKGGNGSLPGPDVATDAAGALAEMHRDAEVSVRYAGLPPRSKARLEELLNQWAAWHAENVEQRDEGNQLLVSITRQVEVGALAVCVARSDCSFPTGGYFFTGRSWNAAG